MLQRSCAMLCQALEGTRDHRPLRRTAGCRGRHELRPSQLPWLFEQCRASKSAAGGEMRWLTLGRKPRGCWREHMLGSTAKRVNGVASRDGNFEW